MEDELKKISSDELIEIYKKTDEFIKYLNKEYKDAEKMRDSNE